MKLLHCLLIGTFLVTGSFLRAQPSINTNKKNGGYTFTLEKVVGVTPVKNQYKSGTCWVYSSQSFIESEVMRNGKGKYDLSEMFVVHNDYIEKAEHYIRYQGHTNFGEGGEPHDVINSIRDYGIVPKEIYTGMPAGQLKPTHGEMSGVLKAMLDAMLKLPDGRLDPHWKDAYIAALNAYMGIPPDIFTYNNKTFTPKSFAKELGIDADDYIEITSFTHHPFYTQFIMEVPDNWANAMIYNVTLDDMQKIADNAIANDYSIEWGSDVSEKGFSYKNGVAIVPARDYDDMTQAEKDSMFNKPSDEKVITQQLRQEAFDNLSTTDDHGMQIVGKAKDQIGHEYYLVKNSWGTERNDLDGYFYCSVPYFLYKTTSILVNKHAIPKDIAKKMGIKL